VALTLLYFAGAREAAGTARETLEERPATVADLRRLLAERHPALSRVLPRCRIAVDEDLVEDSASLPERGEVAVLPPVSGGAGPFALTDRPLDLGEVVRAVRGTARGAVVTFTGEVRAASRGKRVVRLEYEAYPAMAERKLREIGERVGREHGAEVAIVHRLGRLEPGEAAVVIACAAPHRTPAFRACEAAIELLKKDVPIWKREVFEDGSEWVGLGP
jgi:molybdopterin synthase catalytic subunit